MRSRSFTFVGATEWLLSLLIIPICSIRPGHEKSHVPGEDSAALPVHSCLRSNHWHRWSTSRQDGNVDSAARTCMVLRRLNQEAVYSGPAAEEAPSRREGTDVVASDRRKRYGRMENGGTLYLRAHNTHTCTCIYNFFTSRHQEKTAEKTHLLLRVWAPPTSR